MEGRNKKNATWSRFNAGSAFPVARRPEPSTKQGEWPRALVIVRISGSNRSAFSTFHARKVVNGLF